MRTILILICSVFTLPLLAHAATDTQIFSTSAGPVKITPLHHASTLIEAGGKTIYLDPAKPAKFSALPKADLILITDIHGDHMDPDSIKEVSKAGTEILAPPAVVQTVTAAKPIANGETKTWQGLDYRSDSSVQPEARPGTGETLITTRDAATAMSSPTAASDSTSQATPKACPRCALSRTSTWRSCA